MSLHIIINICYKFVTEKLTLSKSIIYYSIHSRPCRLYPPNCTCIHTKIYIIVRAYYYNHNVDSASKIYTETFALLHDLLLQQLQKNWELKNISLMSPSIILATVYTQRSDNPVNLPHSRLRHTYRPLPLILIFLHRYFFLISSYMYTLHPSHSLPCQATTISSLKVVSCLLFLSTAIKQSESIEIVHPCILSLVNIG
jgi:hypothetical protein